MKRTGKKAPNAISIRGGGPRGREKSATCQKPIHVRHQKVIIGFGRKRTNSAHVTRMFRASAMLRRSLQCVKTVDSSTRNETGKTVGNPIEDRPFAVYGKKFVKL